nr:hypothetical protein [Candidatus Baldrarchaeota archaeon]
MVNIIEPKEILVSKGTLIALSEGRIKFKPDIKIKFGRYIIKNPSYW